MTLIGAGTVLAAGAVEAASAAGAALIVAPNADPSVIERALRLGLFVLPGVATPTEVRRVEPGSGRPDLFPAKKSHAARSGQGLALRPAEGDAAFSGRRHLARSIRHCRLAGADGFGVGGALYRPDDGFRD
jgi:2-dehydro-3-deoxyphosphogalactonate aldolase